MENNLNNFVSLYIARIIVAKKLHIKIMQFTADYRNYVIRNEIDALLFGRIL